MDDYVHDNSHKRRSAQTVVKLNVELTYGCLAACTPSGEQFVVTKIGTVAEAFGSYLQIRY